MPSPDARVETMELIIGNRSEELQRVTQAVDELIARHRLPDPALNMQIALDEVLSNIVNYAYDNGAKHQIRIRLSVYADAIEAEVEDDGPEFDPLSAAEPSSAHGFLERKPGGAGIRVVKRMMSQVAYRRVADCNRLQLRIRFER